jgi:uncharacterized membrane protein YeiB
VGRSHERVRSLDILRGFALLGMILVHVHQHLEQPATGLEDLISWVIWVGVEQKSWATFRSWRWVLSPGLYGGLSCVT